MYAWSTWLIPFSCSIFSMILYGRLLNAFFMSSCTRSLFGSRLSMAYLAFIIPFCYDAYYSSSTLISYFSFCPIYLCRITSKSSLQQIGRKLFSWSGYTFFSMYTSLNLYKFRIYLIYSGSMSILVYTLSSVPINPTYLDKCLMCLAHIPEGPGALAS